MNKEMQQTKKSLVLIITSLTLLVTLGYIGYMSWVVFSLPLIQEQVDKTLSIILFLDDYQKFSYPILSALALGCILLILIMVEVYQRSSKRSEIERNNHQAILMLLGESDSLRCSELDKDYNSTLNENSSIAEAINFVTSRLQSDSKITQGLSDNFSATVNEIRVIASQLAEASDHQSNEIKASIKVVKGLEVALHKQSVNLKNTIVETKKISSLSEKSTVIIQKSIIGLRHTQNAINDKSKNINKLSKNFKEIESIAFALDDMADQAHILGLNAAIQASTAGDAGKGFSVVAEEVQRLAERSGVATKRITALINVAHVETDETCCLLDEILRTVAKDKKISEGANLEIKNIEVASLLLTEQIHGVIESLTEQESSAINVSKTMNVIQDISSQLLFGTNNTAEIMNELADAESRAVKGILLESEKNPIIEAQKSNELSPDAIFKTDKNQSVTEK